MFTFLLDVTKADGFKFGVKISIFNRELVSAVLKDNMLLGIFRGQQVFHS